MSLPVNASCNEDAAAEWGNVLDIAQRSHLVMNSSIYNQTALSTGNKTAAADIEVQVTQLWGGNAIAQKHATEGALSFLVGETEIEIVHFQNGELLVTPPANAAMFVDKLMQTNDAFVLRAGHTADITFGDFTFEISVGDREVAPVVNMAAAVLEDPGVRTFAGSGVAHALVLAAVAFFMPSLSQADDDTIDRQRMLDLKAYMTSAAEHEQDRVENQPIENGARSDQRAGEKAAGESGAMGGAKPVTAPGHWAARGDARPENATLARERALKEAAEFGMIGLINASSSSDPNAPIVPWGTVQNGSDPSSRLGNLWSDDIGDAFGTGLGLSGTGEGAGGKGEGIGVGDVGGLGHMLPGNCTGPNCGMGHGSARLAPTHVARGPHLEWDRHVEVNGRLDPAVIQRIVRLNSGRFVGCYQNGLQSNPSLEGRVAVSFMIGRDGGVSMAKDTAGSDLPNQEVRSCVVRSFYGLSFPEPVGGVVSVSYPFTFSPQ